MDINKKIRQELNKTVLSINLSQPYREDYQIRMLQENHLQGLIEVSSFGTELQSTYEYEISGKISISQRYEKKKITSKEMKSFLGVVSELMERLEIHLLDPNCLFLEPDYIYWERGNYYFCYIPGWKSDSKKAFHKLMDSFVQWTDYQDVPSVKLAFLLHKETMEQNYSLKKILEKLKEMEEQKEYRRI